MNAISQPKFSKIIIGNATLYFGNCEDVLPLITPVECIVMDPPYEIKTQGGGKMRKARKAVDAIEDLGINKGFDKHLFHGGSANSIFCFVHNNQFLKVANHLQLHFDRIAICFWRKTNPAPFRNKHYKPTLEIYIHAWNKGGHPVGVDGDDFHRSVDCLCGVNEYGHPTQKPDIVMNKIITNANGEVILDPFAGTGSTGVAALKAGKKFIGIENNRQWFDVMVKRCAEVQGIEL